MTESVGATPIIAESRAEPSFGVTDVLLFAMAMIWGINFVVVKYATHIFNPVAFTGLRVGTVAVFLVIFALSRSALGISQRRESVQAADQSGQQGRLGQV